MEPVRFIFKSQPKCKQRWVKVTGIKDVSDVSCSHVQTKQPRGEKAGLKKLTEKNEGESLGREASRPRSSGSWRQQHICGAFKLLKKACVFCCSFTSPTLSLLLHLLLLFCFIFTWRLDISLRSCPLSQLVLQLTCSVAVSAGRLAR